MNNNQTENIKDELKRIAAKQTLGLPLSDRDIALKTLYGQPTTTADAAPADVTLTRYDKTENADEITQKRAFVRGYLSPLLQVAGLNVKNAIYNYNSRSREETVTVTYNNGFKREICVTADSLRAIVTDVFVNV